MNLLQLNRRLAWVAIGLSVLTGGCGDPGPAQPEASSPHILTLTEATFDHQLQASPAPLVVDFWAPWCGPCRVLSPMLAELANEYHATVRFGKVNVDEQPKLAERYGIRAIPTLLVFKDGNKVDQVVGLPGKPALKEKIAALSQAGTGR